MAENLKEGKKTKYLQETTSNGSDDEDRLSSLQDILLGNIISRLPLHSAVSSSILSRRWRGLWTQFITHLFFNCYDFPGLFNPNSSGSFHEFLTLIDRSLKQITSPNIHTFNLRLKPSSNEDEKDACTRFLQSWIRQICSRNVKEFKISTDICEFSPLVPIPDSIFACQSLEVLDLIGNFNCKMTDNQTINLPNLKKLDIYLPVLNFGLITTIIKLVKSCPLLEILSLSLELSIEGFVIDLCAPNLEYCGIDLYGISQHRSRFVIDAPSLKGISLSGSLAFYTFVSQPCRLQNANIQFRDDANEHLSLFSDLIKGICAISFLGSSNNLAIFNGYQYMGVKTRPIFHNLRELKLGKLSGMGMNERAPIPACLLRKLRYVEMVEVLGEDNDVKLAKYILHNANVLEKLEIWVENLDDYESENGEKEQLWMEYRFCRELFEFPKKSSACKVVFVGFYITQASSEDMVEEGTLGVRLNYLGRKLSD
ncbi:unnamed protein product [Amaranthus hypochondriacus]